MATDLEDDDQDTSDSSAGAAPDDSDASDDDAPASVDSILGGTAPNSSPLHPAVQSYLQKLQDAQAQVKQNQAGTGLASALTQLTHGISRAGGQADLSGIQAIAKSDTAPVDNLVAQEAGQSQDLKLKNEQEADDPNAPVAKQLRQLYQPMLDKLGLDPKSLDGLGATQIKSFVQQPIESSEKQQVLQTNKELALAQQQANNQARMQSAKDKADAAAAIRNDKMAGALKDDLDPNKGRVGNLGKSQAMINAADRVNALFNQFPDGNIPQSQQAELAAASAALVGGGTAQSQQQINEMVPHSMVGDANKIASWFTNEPRGSGQQAFANLLQESANREKEVAQNQVRSAQVQRLAAHKAYKMSDPDGFNEILHGYGIEPEDIKDGKYSPRTGPASSAVAAAGSPAAHPQDSQAVQWAKQNPNDPRAAKIIQLNGGQ